jgi:hypothetical protein
MTSQRTKRGRFLSVPGVPQMLLLAQPAGAVYEYPATGYFLQGLSEHSSWNEILKTPGVRADFPFISFGSTFVPLSSVCVGGDMLAIADPRIDPGARVSAEGLRAQVRAAAPSGGYPTSGPFAAAVPPNAPSQVSMAYPVEVYLFTERGFFRDWKLLFQKPWPILVCPAK